MVRGLCLAVCLALGCDVGTSVELLEVDAIAGDAVSPGARLRIAGHGFPIGREGTLALEGTAYRPGGRPIAVRARARGRAVSDEAFEVRVTDALVDEVGGRATFAGTVRVMFEAAHGRGVVAGSLHETTLDFIPAEREQLHRESHRRESAIALFDRIGVTVVPPATDALGMVVDGVVTDGLAADAGLAKGDRIVAVDGVRLVALADASPSPGEAPVELLIEREGEAAPITLRVARETAAAAASLPTLAIATLALVLGLVFLFLAPTARATAALARAVASLRARRLASEELAPRGAPPARAQSSLRDVARASAWNLIAALAGILALGVLPFTTRIYTGGVDVGVLLFAVLIAQLVLSPGSFRERIKRFLACVVPAAAALAAVVLFVGTFRLAGIVAVQGGAPWEWHALRNPVAFLAFPVFVVATLARDATPPRTTTAEVLDRVQRFLMAGLATAVFLGGFALPFVAGDPLDGPPVQRLLGAAVFVAKAWIVYAVSARIERAPGHVRWTIPLALACAALAATTLIAPWPPAIESIGGPVLAALTVCITLYALTRRDDPRPALPPLPFA